MDFDDLKQVALALLLTSLAMVVLTVAIMAGLALSVWLFGFKP